MKEVARHRLKPPVQNLGLDSPSELQFLDAKRQARLATLSACQTDMIGTKTIEEVVGLLAREKEVA
jgi:CHAT domain-containing protein